MVKRSGNHALRDHCERYAKKYHYRGDQLERGLEGYAAHLFIQEEGYNVALDGEDTAEADLSQFICRANDLTCDVVLRDEIGKQLMLVQAHWSQKGPANRNKAEHFCDAPARLRDPDYRGKGSEQIQDLLDGFEDMIKDNWQLVLRYVTNRPIGDDDAMRTLLEAKNDA